MVRLAGSCGIRLYVLTRSTLTIWLSRSEAILTDQLIDCVIDIANDRARPAGINVVKYTINTVH